VSEWAPIKQYGIEGVKSEPHTWIQIKKYPLNHEPSWGNLIFVNKNKHADFKKELNKYLRVLYGNKDNLSKLKNNLKKIPGVKLIYYTLKRR